MISETIVLRTEPDGLKMTPWTRHFAGTACPWFCCKHTSPDSVVDRLYKRLFSIRRRKKKDA